MSMVWPTLRSRTAKKTELLHPFNVLFSRTTWVSWYQKGKTSLDLNEARGYGGLDAVASAGPYASYLHLAADTETVTLLKTVQSPNVK